MTEEEIKDAITRLHKLYIRLGNEELKRLWGQLNPVFEDATFSRDEFLAALAQWEEAVPIDAQGASELKPQANALKVHGSVSSGHKSSALEYYSLFGVKSNKIPVGWTALQWCIFASVGWPYELLIYQKRIENLMDQLIDAQVRVHPANRFYLHLILTNFSVPSALARGPKPYDPSKLPGALKSLIKDKVKKQDSGLRKCLKDGGAQGSETQALYQLFVGGPFENTVLPLATFILERSLGVVRKAMVDVIDVREFLPFVLTMMGIQALILAKLKLLQAQFNKAKRNISDAMCNHFNGLFCFSYRQFVCEVPHMTLQAWDPEEVDRRLENTELLKDFEVDFSDFVLEYETWSDHFKSHPEKESLDPIPPGWNVDLASLETQLPARESDAFPFHSTTRCDLCGQCPISERESFHCIDCPDLDLCAECYKLPIDEEKLAGHTATHVMVKYILNFPTPYREWMTALVKKRLASFKETTSLSKTEPICSECGEVVSDDTNFFVCVEACCPDYILCISCEPKTSERFFRTDKTLIIDEEAQHKFWHSTFVLRQRPSFEDRARELEKKITGAMDLEIISQLLDLLAEAVRDKM